VRLAGALGADGLARADLLVLALWLDEAQGPSGRLLVAVRGKDHGRGGLGRWLRRRRSLRHPGSPPARALRSAAGARPQPRAWGEYRGVPLLPGRGAANATASAATLVTAVATERTVVAGPRPLVRQAVDLLRAVPGYASVREDRELMALWRRVAGTSAGRSPVVAAAARFPSAVQQRMTRRLGLKAPPLRAAARVSAAGWVTVRAFVDCPGTEASRRLIEALQKAVQLAGRSRLARALGAAVLLSRLAVHQEGARVYLQWLAPAARLDPLVKRLEALPR
jgi:hypothetical protein